MHRTITRRVHAHVLFPSRRIRVPSRAHVRVYVPSPRVPAVLPFPTESDNCCTGLQSGLGERERERKDLPRARRSRAIAYHGFLGVRVPASSHRPAGRVLRRIHELKCIMLYSVRARGSTGATA